MELPNNSLQINFGIFNLTVDSQDKGGTYYRDPNFFAELNTPLNQYIAKVLKPEVCIDIGANYGFTSLITLTHNPIAKLIAVEASPKLLPFLNFNLSQGNSYSCRIINAVCNYCDNEASHFCLNPHGSQDNRVTGASSWQRISVPSISLDGIFQEIDYSQNVYIKIDTQGSEENIFEGAKVLKERSNWLLKTEFAPFWLRTQGTDPINFLKKLCGGFLVYELPKRFTMKWSLPGQQERILEEDCESFVVYLEKLVVNKKGELRGWCDLLLLPSDYKYMKFAYNV